MRIDLTWLEILSELLINLAAGWFGAVFVVPNFSGMGWPYNFAILTGDVLAGTLGLIIAFKLRRWSRGK